VIIETVLSVEEGTLSVFSNSRASDSRVENEESTKELRLSPLKTVAIKDP